MFEHTREIADLKETTMRHRRRHHRTRSLLVSALMLVGGLIVGASPASAGDVYEIVNADGGIFYRNSPSWADTDQIIGVGIYNGDQVELICGAWGEAVGPYANRRWHLVENLSRDVGVGWVADRFLTTPNVANELTPGEPECSDGTTDTDPAGPTYARGSVFYSGVGHAGYDDIVGEAPSAIMTADGAHGTEMWVLGNCGTSRADDYLDTHPGVTTLAGWSLGRLGPIFALAESETVRNTVNYVLMYDPGTIEELSGCDARVGASYVLADWLSRNPANRLVIMAGELTARNHHQSIQDIYFRDAIRGTALAAQVTVCNVQNGDTPWSHEDVMRGYAWMIHEPPPSGCPSGFLPWQP